MGVKCFLALVLLDEDVVGLGSLVLVEIVSDDSLFLTCFANQVGDQFEGLIIFLLLELHDYDDFNLGHKIFL